jgi:phosphatidylglycerophosphatase GEP4
MVDMNNFNVSATLNIFRVLTRPSLCLPQATISTFNQLPIPLDKAFTPKYGKTDIRAVVLDKDNCFAQPGKDEVYKEYEVS